VVVIEKALQGNEDNLLANGLSHPLPDAESGGSREKSFVSKRRKKKGRGYSSRSQNRGKRNGRSPP